MSEEFLTTYHQDPKFLRTLYDNLQPNKFVRDGFAFCGWSRTPGGSVEFEDGASCSFEEDVTNLYAVWKLDNWTISYDMNGHGTCPDDVLTSYNSSTLLEDYFPPMAEDVVEGDSVYSFLFWEPFYLPVDSTGNQTFKAIWQENGAGSPGFKTIAILDISGSMDTNDYIKSAVSITANLLNTKNVDAQYSKLQLFYGTYITNVAQAESNYLTSFDVSKTDLASEAADSTKNPTGSNLVETYLAYSIKKNVLDSIRKSDTSEAMLTCLYFAIDRVMTEIDSDATPLDCMPTRAINFLFLTDEHILYSERRNPDNTAMSEYVSSLRGYRALIDASTWLKNWQENTFGQLETYSQVDSRNGIHYMSTSMVQRPDTLNGGAYPPNYESRFPVPNIIGFTDRSGTIHDGTVLNDLWDNWDNVAWPRVDDVWSGTDMYTDGNIWKAKSIVNMIINNFKQMSYYYGINFTIGIYNDLSASNADRKISCANSSAEDGNKVFPAIVDITKLSDGTSSGFGWAKLGNQVSYCSFLEPDYNYNTWALPADSQIYDVTDEMVTVRYINCEIVSAKKMNSNDKYNKSSAKTKIHCVDGRWFQFKFPSDTLTLPTSGEVVQKDGKTLSKWKLITPTGSVDYSPGTTLSWNMEGPPPESSTPLKLSDICLVGNTLMCFQAIY